MSSVLGRRVFVWGVIGANVFVSLQWKVAISESTKPAPSRQTPASRGNIVTLADLQMAESSSSSKLRFMEDNFVMSAQNLRAGRWWTPITSAFSHRDLDHLFFNMFTFHFAATGAFTLGLGLPRIAILSLGSILGSSYLGIMDGATRNTQHAMERGSLGASGMVEGLLMWLTLTIPHWPVSLMFIPVPIPLWGATGGFLAWDMYRLYEARRTGQDKENWAGKVVGHAAHLGGAVFGTAFYVATRGRVPLGRR